MPKSNRYGPIAHPSPRELTAALRMFVGGQPGAEQEEQVERCRQALAGGGYDPEGLFVLHEAGRLSGVILVQAMPGALGVAWPPRGETPAAEDLLTIGACDWLRDRGVKTCQAFASPDERPGMAPLERNGFRYTTQLVFLNHPAVSRPTVPPRADVQCVPISGELSPECRQVLLDTHIQTLDCPELIAARTPDEIVTSFLGDDGSWYAVHAGGRMVGLLLLEKAPAGSALELSYLGLVPEARGRGIAGAALGHAIRTTAAEGYPMLCLSVDERNAPALRLYLRHEFIETHRHDVFLAQWQRL